MTEIKLEKRFPHIPDEDVTRIFQDGYRKGWENARKKAIPIEWIEEYYKYRLMPKPVEWFEAIEIMIEDWEKENEKG